jgi:RimJ/RimL family protein N-acetyltransferase
MSGAIGPRILAEHNRVALRELAGTDAEAVFAYRSLPEVCRYQCWEPASIEEVRGFIDGLTGVELGTPGRWLQLAVLRRDGGELVGDCGIQVLADDPSQAEVGITLAPGAQGRGLATEAMQALLGLLLGRLGLHRVIGSVDPRNMASVALMHRLGLRQEAHHVESLRFKGGWADDLVFAILDREWRDRDKAAGRIATLG